MIDISKLSWNERVFLAGSLKALILADGIVDDSEISEVDKLRDIEHFDDLDDALDEFESEVKTDEQYWERAATIRKREAQDIMLDVLREVALAHGYEKEAEDKFISHLEQIWLGTR